METINFYQLKKILDEEGFDTAISDNVLEASTEEGDASVEITIDSGGGCLVKKTQKEDVSKNATLAGKSVKVIYRNSQIAQVRTQISATGDLLEILKSIDKI